MRPAIPRLILAAAMCGIPTVATSSAFAQQPAGGGFAAAEPAPQSHLFDVDFGGGPLPEFVAVLNKATKDVNFVAFPGDPSPDNFIIPVIHLRNVSFRQLARTLTAAGIVSNNNMLAVDIDEEPGDGTPIVRFNILFTDRKAATTTRICQLASVIPSTASADEQKKRLADVMQVLELALAASSKDAKPEIQVHAATRTMIITGNATQQAIVDQVRFALAEAENNDAAARRMEVASRMEEAGGVDGIRKEAMIRELNDRLQVSRDELAKQRDVSDMNRANITFVSGELDRLKQALVARDRMLARISTLRTQRAESISKLVSLEQKYGTNHAETLEQRTVIQAIDTELNKLLDSIDSSIPTTQP